jgi:ribokinase
MTICVLGSANLDTVLRVPELPAPGETVAARSSSLHLGGKGANQAVAACRMEIQTTFVGATGRDGAAAWIRDRLVEAGVNIDHLVTLDAPPTGQAVVVVSDNGENIIVVVGGANLALAAPHIPPNLANHHSVFLSQLETPPQAIAALFSDPRAESGVRILNAAPALAEGRDLFPLSDVVVVNETELAVYAGALPAKGLSDPVEAAGRLITWPKQAIVVTLGAAGLIIVREEGVTRVAGHRVDVVDTTGAGDCFCGVLAAELARGATLEDAATFANAASALSVTRLGAASSAPTRAEVKNFLAAQA